MRAAMVACLLLAACGPGATRVTTRAEGRPVLAAPADPTPEEAERIPHRTSAAEPTTTTQAPTTTLAPERPAAASRSRGAANGATVSSTGYCETGTMASGRPTYVGAVAANRWPLGTVLDVSDSPYGPGQFTVEDTIGWGSELDFATPGDCGLAVRWGRRMVTVEVTG